MRIAQLTDSFGLENLQRIEDAPPPSPGRGEVLVQLEAASLNYRDLLMVRGQYNPRQPLPLIPGSDAAGHVVAVGEDVKDFAEGDLVMSLFAQDWIDGPATKAAQRSTLGGPLPGIFCERRLFPVTGLLKAPAHLSCTQAATLPCAAVTAWSALFGRGAPVRPGQSVLILGTGGVSLFALQLALLAGCEVVVTSSSDEKLARVRALGAHHTINYRADPEWGRSARRKVGGEGIDRVVEVGGAGTLEQSLRAVRPSGTISLIGVLAQTKTTPSLLPILMNDVLVQGIFVGSRADAAELLRTVALHRLQPVIDRVFAFDDVGAAFEHLQSGAHFGKICVDLSA